MNLKNNYVNLKNKQICFKYLKKLKKLIIKKLRKILKPEIISISFTNMYYLLISQAIELSFLNLHFLKIEYFIFHILLFLVKFFKNFK